MRFNLFVLVSLLLTSAAYAGEKPAGIPWKTETTPNFSIHYRHVHDIRAIATACEAARTRVHQFWFADDEIGGWAPRCNVYVCGDSEEFSLAGRASAGGAGQSLDQEWRAQLHVLPLHPISQRRSSSYPFDGSGPGFSDA